ncbi:hypothetical protein SF83666_c23800 [Sinorhizobium fredii CCBAU 83666]|nr:hypothetical protein SF83666_c23800 [Sinorhizobium fredii CCBAU 83666]
MRDQGVRGVAPGNGCGKTKACDRHDLLTHRSHRLARTGRRGVRPESRLPRFLSFLAGSIGRFPYAEMKSSP